MKQSVLTYFKEIIENKTIFLDCHVLFYTCQTVTFHSYVRVSYKNKHNIMHPVLYIDKETSILDI